MAEYIGARALRSISMERYAQHVEQYLGFLEQPSLLLPDIRRQSYYTGVILLLTAEDAGIDFYHRIGEEQRPVYRIIEENIAGGTQTGERGYVQELFRTQRAERESTIQRIMSGYSQEAEGNFVIRGYDPMNMWKWGDLLYGRYFWQLLDVERQKTIQLTGESLLRVTEGRKVCHYWVMPSQNP